MPKLQKKSEKIIGLDCETSGLDTYFGARPFLVSFCTEDGINTTYEWPVDPLTRRVLVDEEDMLGIQEIINGVGIIVGQNVRYDYGMLRELFRDHGMALSWNWSKVRDTLIAGHLVASNQPHTLEAMALIHLGININGLEDAVKRATTEARKIAKRDHPGWRIAEEGLPEMPSVKSGSQRDEERPWKNDMWLCRLLADEKHPWETVASDYCNGDSWTAVKLWLRLWSIIRERKLDKIYMESMRLLSLVTSIEEVGVTYSKRRLDELTKKFKTEAKVCHQNCVSASGHTIDVLPVSGNSNALKKVLTERFKLVSNRKTLKGNDSYDAKVLDHWLAILDVNSKACFFIENLKNYRSRMTALNYMDSYRRFARKGVDSDVMVLHPNLNITGTDTLRFSSTNPNSQNVSKKEKFNLRYAFGPASGREWWSLDYQNLELRIPSYEAGEMDAIYVFEHPEESPYFGSYHFLVVDLLHPELFKEHGKAFKDVFASTWYQWVKNGNFAIIYGAQESTADETYHVRGAYAKIRKRFPEIAKLSDKQIDIAEAQGYVETMPDKSVDSERGYPLLCSRSQWGHVSPTVPLNYHVQGTAMWCTRRAMVRVYDCLSKYPGCHMTLQVHDEIVLDLPQRDNRELITVVKRLMEQSGTDIGVPTPVSVKKHSYDWSKGEDSFAKQERMLLVT